MNSKHVAVITVALVIIFAITGVLSVGKASTTMTVTDNLGRTVTITSSERIVSIGPSCTEILYALGLSDRIVGVDVYSDYPPEAVSKQKISNLWTPDLEEIAALNPDLVVMYSFWAPDDPYVKAIEEIGLTVIALAPKTIDDILENIMLVGKATGKSSEAEVLVSAMRQIIDEIKNKTKNVANKPRVYIEYWYPPPWTFGPKTWGHQLIELAGGINAFGDAVTEWIQTTDEEVIGKNPEIVISLYGAMHYATLEDMKKRSGWNTISAIKSGKVYLLDENLFLRPGPRIVEGLKILGKALHPELFGEATLFTFVINTTTLKTDTETLTLTGPVQANIILIKAASNGTLSLATSKLGPSVPANLRLVGDYLDIDSSVSIGLVFILRIHYKDKQIQNQGIDEESLRIYQWDETENKWVSLNCVVNKDENYVEAIVFELSYFALMGEPETPIWAKPVPLWLVSVTTLVAIALVGAGTYTVMRRRREGAGNE
jgi:iron complex transport system substrate-binding protein